MSSRNLFASIVMACLLAVGLGGVASAGQSFLKPGESARNNVIEIKHRSRGPWPNLPIAPTYRAYDWPYYYSRGHYPRISVLAMSTMVIRTPTEAIRDTAADAPIGPRSPCVALGWTPADASAIRAIETKTIGAARVLLLPVPSRSRHPRSVKASCGTRRGCRSCLRIRSCLRSCLRRRGSDR